MPYKCLIPDCHGTTLWPEDYCSNWCRDSVPHCALAGCHKPAWKGQKGKCCSKTCAEKLQHGTWTDHQSDWWEDTWEDDKHWKDSWKAWDASQEKKSRRSSQASKENKENKVKCALAGCHALAYKNLPGNYCCPEHWEQRPFAVELPEKSGGYQKALKYFMEKWQPGLWSQQYEKLSPPEILVIYEFNSRPHRPDFVKCEKAMKDRPRLPHAGEGNLLLRFHGTRVRCAFNGSLCKDDRCAVCRIIEAGKLRIRPGASSGTATFGDGIYFTSMSHTAKGYGLAEGKQQPPKNMVDFVAPDAGNAIFIVEVLAGKVEVVEAQGYSGDLNPQLSQPPDFRKYDSRCVKKSTGNDELVIFNPAQACLRYLIVFGHDP